MADVTPTTVRHGSPVGGGIVAETTTWGPLTSANTGGSAYTNVLAGDMCVQVDGTFDGATVLITGSIDGTTYFTLNDAQGNALSIAAAGKIEQMLESPRYIKPTSSGGGASTSLFVRIFARRGGR
jgi:hypothetical protein